MRGLVHIYTGNGKGKTTAALGLGIRACGSGLKVLMVQFLKGADTGEIHTVKYLEPGFIIYRAQKTEKFTWALKDDERKKLAEVQQAIFNHAVVEAASGRWDMLILDEIMAAVSCGLVSLQEVTGFIRQKPEKLELVLTGRNAPVDLVVLADYVSDIKAVKHPMDKGIQARKGIEN